MISESKESNKEAGKKGFTLVTTHLNADFDALASAYAATKLYPGSKIVLPGSQERSLRDFFVRSSGYFLDVLKLRDVDLSRVEKMVIVDISQRSRLGQLAALLDRPDIEVHLYDHHPLEDKDIAAQKVFHKRVGANTTLMVELLREKKIEISPDEATFLALGIYEDTGSFTFATTTPEDMEAAAYLLQKGADLTLISDLLGHRFTPEHVELLNDLLNTAVTYTIAGVPITVAKTSTPKYVEDFAVLVHELMDMGKLRVVFALALMSDQVLIVGRSREERVDVGQILKELGGGGHAMAASATLKGVTLAEAEEELIAAIHKTLGSEPKVRDIMSAPVLSIPPDADIEQAQNLLTQYGITVLPVVENERILGVISRRTVQKALYHGLSKEPVKEYMTEEFFTVSPEDSFAKVQEIIVKARQRFVPVVEKGRIVGVITRTDLLHILTGDPAREPEPLLAAKTQQKNIASLIREKLPKTIQQLLKKAGEVAEGMGYQVYVVGGFVRDLLLRQPTFDIDLVVEGDGIKFAETLAGELGARVKAHEKFKTAVVIMDGRKIDVATARWEYYEYPAAMPTVALSSIKLDLYRRDFTINTLAVKLNPKEFGTLIDFFGGQRDLKDRVIRVLHSLSFVEDPTRAFRAVRFEQRYKFKIGKNTLRLLKNALKLGVFDRLSGKRLLHELQLIFQEPDPLPAIRRLHELGLLKVLHPSMDLTPEREQILRNSREILSWYELLYFEKRPLQWVVYLLALLAGLRLEDVRKVVARLGITGKVARIFTRGIPKVRYALRYLARHRDIRPSQVYNLFHDMELELLLHLMALAPDDVQRKAVSRFITELQGVRPALSGNDLKRLGIPPGPQYKRIFERLLQARLDGEVKSKKDEEKMVLKEFKKETIKADA